MQSNATSEELRDHLLRYAILESIMNLITISEDLRDTIAKKLAEESCEGYHDQGRWYLITTAQGSTRVAYAEHSRAWDPWNDDAKVIRLLDLCWHFGGAADDAVDFSWSKDEDDNACKIAIEFIRSYVPPSYDSDQWTTLVDDAR
jgi:hypothetical protein